MAVDPKKLVAAISPDDYCDDINLGADELAELKDKLEKPLREWSYSGGIPSIKNRKDAVKFLAKTGTTLKKDGAYLRAAELAKPKESDFMDFDEVIATPFKTIGLKNPIEQH